MSTRYCAPFQKKTMHKELLFDFKIEATWWRDLWVKAKTQVNSRIAPPVAQKLGHDMQAELDTANEQCLWQSPCPPFAFLLVSQYNKRKVLSQSLKPRKPSTTTTAQRHRHPMPQFTWTLVCKLWALSHFWSYSGYGVYMHLPKTWIFIFLYTW